MLVTSPLLLNDRLGRILITGLIWFRLRIFVRVTHRRG